MPRIVIAYCNLEFQAITEETPKPSYVFNLGKKSMIEESFSTNSLSEDPTTASLELVCPNHLVSCEYSPKENSLLAGGCYNGQVCYWDDRSVSHSLLHHLTTQTPTEPAASLWGRSLSPPPTGSQCSRQCGSQARLGLSSSQPHQTERSCRVTIIIVTSGV